MTATAAKLLTADEFEALPASEQERYELIAGELHEHMSSHFRHSRHAKRIDGPLWQYVSENRLGEVVSSQASLRIGDDPGTIIIPDVAFVRAENVPSMDDDDRYLRVAPDLAVEVLSESNRPSEIAKKVQLYLEAGTRLVWLVDPADKTVTVFRAGRPARTLGAGAELDGEDVVPGFRLMIDRIFGS